MNKAVRGIVNIEIIQIDCIPQLYYNYCLHIIRAHKFGLAKDQLRIGVIDARVEEKMNNPDSGLRSFYCINHFVAIFIYGGELIYIPISLKFVHW